MDRSILKSKFQGCLLGAGVGDAIGEMAFRWRDEASLREAVAHAPTLVYTDDTAMAIGLAESLVQAGRIDPQHLGDTFRANFDREPWRGYASGPPTIFATVERYSMPYVEVAAALFDGEGSLGNGAAMRVAPAGLFFHTAPDLYDQARASAVVTHAHPVGVDGAAVLACAVAQAVALDPAAPFPLDVFSQRLVDFARTPVFRDKLQLARDLAAVGASPASAARRLGQGVAAHESVPFAVYAFLRNPISFEACLLCAVLNGGDRDTLGAMACAVSGAYLGVEAIPRTWWQKLENREYIEGLAIRLWETSTV